jgi:hypothetical protein
MITCVFNGQPLRSILRGDPFTMGPNTSDPWHMHNLRQGHTSATIEDISSSQDGGWIAMGGGTVLLMSLSS